MTDKPNYTKPTSQLDLERRQKKGYESPLVRKVGSDAPLSENGYVGTDTIYQNHANDTEAPVKVSEGVEAKVLNEFIKDDADFSVTATPESVDDKEPEVTNPVPTGSTTPTTPSKNS